MTWLITGGCGFVGSNLVDAALACAGTAVVVDSLRRAGSTDNLAWLRERHGRGWRFEKFDVCNSLAGVAGGVRRVLSDPGLAETVASNGYDLVRERYTWDVVSAALIRVDEAVLQGRRPVSTGVVGGRRSRSDSPADGP